MKRLRIDAFNADFHSVGDVVAVWRVSNEHAPRGRRYTISTLNRDDLDPHEVINAGLAFVRSGAVVNGKHYEYLGPARVTGRRTSEFMCAIPDCMQVHRDIEAYDVALLEGADLQDWLNLARPEEAAFD